MQKRKTRESYSDGVCTIFIVANIAPPGKKPVEGLSAKHPGLRYRERTLGMSRYYMAAQANTRIDRLIRVARLKDVTTQDRVTTEDGALYYIRQVQYPEGVAPPAMDLTLERVTPG